MKIVAIVQARMGSTRLPGKVLMDLAGETVLTRVIRRIQRSSAITETIIATTVSSSDEKIVTHAQKLGVSFFCGSEDDVLDRYWQACIKFNADIVIRITSDCPLIDAELIDQTIRVFFDQRADYASNDLASTYPRGLGVEVFTSTALEKAWKEGLESYQREHVTPYFYQHPELFRLASLTSETDYSHYRWTLDTPEDLELLRTIYTLLPERENFHWREVIRLLEKHPEISSINAHVRQKHFQET